MKLPDKSWLEDHRRAASAGVVCLLLAACSPPGSKVPADVQPVAACAVSAPTFATWFKSGSVSLDGEVTPADSVHFTNNPNCDFYVWSARMFLWLASPTPVSYGGGGGRIFNSAAFYDVSPAAQDGGLPVRTFVPHQSGLTLHLALRASQLGPHELPLLHTRDGRFLELAPTPLSERQKPMIRNGQGALVEIERSALDARGAPQFFDAAGRQIQFQRPQPEGADKITPGRIVVVQKFIVGGKAFLIGEFGSVLQAEQAEADDGVLMAQNGSLVYYTIEVNDVYAYFATGIRTGAIPSSTSTTFPTTSAELAPIVAFAGSHSVTFPDPEALAIELKTAWVEATGLPSGCNYITMKATIPTYDTSSSTHWVENGHKTTTLAMIGTHVVGSAAGHPEMIWATFEHVCNAPNPGYTYNKAGSSGPQPGPAEHGPWLLSASNSPSPSNVMRMGYDGSASPAAIDANMSSPLPHVIGPSDILRSMPWGVAGSNAGSNTQVLTTDNSVLSQLVAGDIRANYIMTGATWTIGGVINGAQVGTNKLANTTMETFQQGSLNCFDCHTGVNLGDDHGNGLSHVFGELKPLF